MLYSSSHGFSFLSWIYLVLVYNHDEVTFSRLKVLMYCKFLLDDTFRSSWLLPRSDNLLYQSSCLSCPSSLMLWGAFCYTQIFSPACDKISNTFIFPQSQTWSEKNVPDVDPTYKNSSIALTLKLISGTLYNIAWVMWKTGGATAFHLCFWCGSHLALLCHKGV